MRFVGGGGGMSWVSALRLANACDEGVVMLAVSTFRMYQECVEYGCERDQGSDATGQMSWRELLHLSHANPHSIF